MALKNSMLYVEIQLFELALYVVLASSCFGACFCFSIVFRNFVESLPGALKHRFPFLMMQSYSGIIEVLFIV